MYFECIHKAQLYWAKYTAEHR